MSKILLKSLLVSPAVLGAALAVSSVAVAAEVKVNSELPQAQTAALQPKTLQPQTLAAAPEAPKAEAAPVFSSNLASTSVPVASLQVAANPVEKAAAAPKPASTVVAQAAPETTDSSSLDQINRYSREGRAASQTNQMGQVTSVSQLSDVRPTDWAFQALQSLVERYGCIVGYPDRTYRGNQALTRYEFAAGLNACIDRVNELIAAATTDLVRKEDLDTLRRLQEEFAAELATLRGRVDALEARTATLEKQQFSTTTKLAGEVIFAVTDEFGQNGADNNTVFQDRVRLALNTSFTGKDLLVTRLAAGNAERFSQPGDEGTQTFNIGNTGGNSVAVDWVAYFGSAFNDRVKFYIPAFGGLHYDYAPTLNPALDAFDGGTGPLSVFAQRNPIYNIGGGSGLGLNFNLGPLQASVGYLADNGNTGANIPSAGNGLFNGSFSALGQLAFTTDRFGLGATYVRAYRNGEDIFNLGGGTGFVGSTLANGAGQGAARVNAFGLEGYFKVTPNIVFNAYGSYIEAKFNADDNKSEIWTYGAGLAFPDLGKRGNLLGFAAGVQPYLGNTAVNNNPIHLEGFYKYQLNDNISITPGVIWVINPNQDNNNDDVIIGTVRTTFTF